ncbi:MAG: 4-phosphopantetheinyl transferase family protein [Flavobacteriaceae bacterium]|nr:4-phosphopantetheinyl transferase family protein [Flavobacteriaceae bacterium]
MIGNDIVDFNTAALQSNWQRRGFLEKLFTKNEQSLILNSEFPERRLWLLWAMKEATYKAHQRRFKLFRSFNPKQLNCEIIDAENNSVLGKVQNQDFSYYTQTYIGEDYLHCIASQFQQKKTVQKILSHSTDIKQELILAVSALKKLPLAKISIKKDGNFIPYLTFDGFAINCDFSISHHGIFSAFVLSLTQS